MYLALLLVTQAKKHFQVKVMELSSNVAKFVFGVILTITAFIGSHTYYFKENPLFGIPFFGQTLLGFAAGAFGILVFPSIIIAIKNWIEKLIVDTVGRVASDFWREQQQKLADSRKKREEEKALEEQKVKDEKEKKAQEKHKLGLDMVDKHSVLLDTSAIIDGRILEVVKTGFLDNRIIVPRVVLEELQLISDNSDNLKRARGRRGLDMIRDLKKVVEVVILEKSPEDKFEGVDKALVKIAKDTGAAIATVDFNLNKVASVSGIKVLNVNDLSNAIKAVVLPGESMQIKIVQVGKDKSQGVGYLEDGTMIVVEGGSELIGKEAEVVISRVIQTPAGKMFFAKRG